MRILFFLLALIFAVSAAQAQSVSDDLPSAAAEGAPPPSAPAPIPAAPPSVAVPAPSGPPSAQSQPASPPAPADPYTVTDVHADATADTAAHARDQALLQAERAAFAQLCARMGAPGGAAKIDDDALQSLVRSFEVQSEQVSAVRYIGVFTVQFDPALMKKQMGTAAPAPVSAPAAAGGDDNAPPVVIGGKAAPQGPVSHVTVGVEADSLAAFMRIKRRLGALPQVANVEMIDLGRGLSHIDLAYSGSIFDLQQGLTAQGLVLRQTPTGAWDLYDGSMIAR